MGVGARQSPGADWLDRLAKTVSDGERHPTQDLHMHACINTCVHMHVSTCTHTIHTCQKIKPNLDLLKYRTRDIIQW